MIEKMLRDLNSIKSARMMLGTSLIRSKKSQIAVQIMKKEGSYQNIKNNHQERRNTRKLVESQVKKAAP